MRVILLTHGAGNGIDKACLMTASNMLIGRGEDGDDNSCVCPVIRKFIVNTNDAIPESLLGEIYGPLVWDILGTRNDDPNVMQRRAFCFADWAVREIAPLALDVCGLEEWAKALRELPVVSSKNSADAAARAATYAAYVADAAAAAADAGARDVRAARAALAAADAAARAATNAACAALAAYVAALVAVGDTTAAETIWRSCADVIRRAAAIGDKRPVERVITEEQLCDALSGEARKTR